MSSVTATARDFAVVFVDKCTPKREPLSAATAELMVAQAFARGAVWGIERAQHAAAITHAKFQAELEEDR
jgi:hypothetical protein